MLKRENRFLHFREIAKYIIETEEGTDDIDEEDISQLAAKLSSSCQQIKTDKVIVKVQVGTSNKDYVWGSPKWLDKGKIKPEHAYNEEFFKSKSTVEDDFEL